MTDHARARGGGDRMFLECSRCGSSVTVLLPIKLSDSGALMMAFGREHAECEPGGALGDLSLSTMSGSVGADGTGQVELGFTASEAAASPAPDPGSSPEGEAPGKP